MSPLERKMLLYFGDVATSIAALLLIVNWRNLEPAPSVEQPVLAGWSVLLALVHTLVGPAMDAYDLRAAARPTSGAKLGLRTGLAVSLVYLLIPYITPSLLTSRQTAALFVVVATGGTVIWRIAYSVFLGAPRVRRLVVIGSGLATLATIDLIGVEHLEFSVTHIGRSREADRSLSDGPEIAADSLRLLLAEERVDEIVVEDEDDAALDHATLKVILDANEGGVAVTPTVELFERLSRRLPLEYLGTSREVLKVLLPLRRAHQPALSRAGKRIIDMAFGIMALVLATVLAPFIFLLNLLEGPGPLFYRQERIGLAGSRFDLVKFRTMVTDAEPGGPRWSEPDDVRVTRLGRVLRRLHLDELPQGLNIVRGQMSLVGPRPERPAMVETLGEEIPYYTARHAILPGLTGWAQVNHQYVSTKEGALRRLEYDLYYAKHMSVTFDLAIVAATLSGLRRFPGQ